MCGLIGYSGKDPMNVRWIELLILWNSLERGEDATGIFSPKNGLKKSLTKGSHYVLYPKNQLLPDKYFIGHVRAGTVGDKTEVKNAHPFERGNFILAHNGTLHNHWDLLEKYNLTRADYSVDSDALTGCINANGEIAPVIKEIAGAAALLIHDKRTPTILNVFRKSGTTYTERPLYRGHDKNGNMYISSLSEPLFWIGLLDVKPFKEDTLYTIENGEVKTTRKVKNVPYSKPTPAYNYSRHGYSPTLKDDEFRDLNIRCKHPMSIDYHGKRPNLNLVKDAYYTTKWTDPNNHKNCIVLYNGNEYSISKTFFRHEDIIAKGDLVRCNEDIITYSSNVDFKKGDVVIVNQIFSTDGELKCRDLMTGKEMVNWKKKTMFTKLTSEERIELYKDNQLALWDLLANEASQEANTCCSTENNRTFSLTDDSKDEPFERDDKFLVSYSELETIFGEIDDQLEKLNADIKSGERSEIQKKLTKLIDYVFTQRALLLEPNIAS